MQTANRLTVIRIITSPFFIIFFMVNTVWSFIGALMVLIIIEITDFMDGRIARKNNQITDFGKIMDPFADSISRFSAMLCFLRAGLAPIWMVAVFFYRDVLVSVIRVFAMREGVVVAARKSGKIKAWAQGIALFAVTILLLVQKIFHLSKQQLLINGIHLATYVIAIAAVVTMWSAVDYWLANKAPVIKAMKPLASKQE